VMPCSLKMINQGVAKLHLITFVIVYLMIHTKNFSRDVKFSQMTSLTKPGKSSPQYKFFLTEVLFKIITASCKMFVTYVCSKKS